MIGKKTAVRQSNGIVRQYLGGEGSAFLSKRESGEMPYERAVHVRCSPETKAALLDYATRIGNKHYGRPLSVSEMIKILLMSADADLWLTVNMPFTNDEVVAIVERFGKEYIATEGFRFVPPRTMN